MAWKAIPQVTFMPLTMNTMLFIDSPPVVASQPWFVILAYSGLILSAWPPTAICILRPIKSTGRRAFMEGVDMRLKPYALFRVKVDAKPVLLRN